MTKQEALAQLEEKLGVMQKALKEAQALADEHGLTFKASLGGVESPFDDYGDREVKGTYHGVGSEDYGDGESNKKGYWYWENSSMNC